MNRILLLLVLLASSGFAELPKNWEIEGLKKMAEAGNARAQNWLGLKYYYGTNIPNDRVIALKWLNKAAEQGHADAALFLGQMYMADQPEYFHLAQDYRQAALWLTRAAAADDQPECVQAAYALSRLYEGDRVGWYKNDLLAAEWHRKADEKNNAIYMGGSSGYVSPHYDDNGLFMDEIKAVEDLRQRAKLGQITAQWELGRRYYRGEGVDKDYVQAVNFIRKGAEGSSSSWSLFARNDLGIMYARGEGVPKDLVQAHAWFNLAAIRGDAEAKRNLKKIEKQMTPEQQAEAMKLARELFAKLPKEN